MAGTAMLVHSTTTYSSTQNTNTNRRVSSRLFVLGGRKSNRLISVTIISTLYHTRCKPTVLITHKKHWLSRFSWTLGRSRKICQALSSRPFRNPESGLTLTKRTWPGFVMTDTLSKMYNLHELLFGWLTRKKSEIHSMWFLYVRWVSSCIESTWSCLPCFLLSSHMIWVSRPLRLREESYPLYIQHFHILFQDLRGSRDSCRTSLFTRL